MGNFIDLTGQIFGRLSVIEKQDEDVLSNNKYHVIKWLCCCKCGNEVVVRGDSLRNGVTLSCGCYHKERIHECLFEDLTGRIFGRLKVIDIHSKNNKNSTKWNCLCECGNKTVVEGKSLKSGVIKSCGCLKSELLSIKFKKNMSEKTFGRLKVLNEVSERSKSGIIKYKCECSCGRNIIVSGESLRSGSTKSCGCLSESFIANELKKYFVKNHNAITEYKIVKNPDTNRYLPYDIYIPHNVFVEIQGHQHYRYALGFYYNTKKDFEHRIKLDKIKKKYAQKNGLYVEVDLRKVKTVEEGIVFIEDKLSEIGVPV